LTKVDLIETFHYLIGADVRQYWRETHQDRKYVVTNCDVDTETGGEKILTVWRQTEDIDLDKEKEWFDDGFDSESYDRVYVNGESQIAQAEPSKLRSERRWRRVPMSRSALEKLRKRMALTAYFRDFFGVDDPNDPDSVRQYYEEPDNQEEGYDDEGRSDVYRFVSFKSDSEVLTPEQLLQYDENVRMHTEALNERRSDPITLKPFQVLACLMTEAYLDRVVNNREAFCSTSTSLSTSRTRKRDGSSSPSSTTATSTNWHSGWQRAVGRHCSCINYYQYLDYVEDSDALPENILLVTPNEGLSEQHIEDLRESSIPCHHFNAETIELQGVGKPGQGH